VVIVDRVVEIPTVSSLYQELAASVGPMAHLPNNGAAYHTGEQVITHLNRVLGPGNWSFRILELGEESDSEECWAFGEITATINGATVVKQDYGSQAFKKARATGKYVSKWDDKKSASTDALKRCARLLGVGLDAWANERAPSWHPDIDMIEKKKAGAAKQDHQQEPVQRHDPEPEPQPQAPIRTVADDVADRANAKVVVDGDGHLLKSNDEPKVLKTKVQLVDDMKRGIAMAKSLGLDPAEQDPQNMDRVAIQDVISALAKQIKIVKAARAEAAS
jgi:hypothetical protein